jgi:hypothetical protein
LNVNTVVIVTEVTDMRVCSFFVVGFMDWALFTGVDKYLAKSPG